MSVDDTLHITGGVPLYGTVPVRGSKNAVPKLMVAALLTEQAVTIRNTVALPCYWEQFTADGGWPRPSAGYEASAKLMLDQLVWWAAALQDARKRRPYRH